MYSSLNPLKYEPITVPAELKMCKTAKILNTLFEAQYELCLKQV